MLTRCPAYWFKTPARNSCAPRAARVIAHDGSAKVITWFVRPAAWKARADFQSPGTAAPTPTVNMIQLQNVPSLRNFIISFFCFLKNQFFCSNTSDILLFDQKNLVLWLAGMNLGLAPTLMMTR